MDPDEVVLLAAEKPTTYHEVPFEMVRQEVMQNKLEVIQKNKTWALTDLPFDHKSIYLKWVVKLQKDSEGDIIKHKVKVKFV